MCVCVFSFNEWQNVMSGDNAISLFKPAACERRQCMFECVSRYGLVCDLKNETVVALAEFGKYIKEDRKCKHTTAEYPPVLIYNVQSQISRVSPVQY